LEFVLRLQKIACYSTAHLTTLGGRGREAMDLKSWNAGHPAEDQPGSDVTTPTPPQGTQITAASFATAADPSPTVPPPRLVRPNHLRPKSQQVPRVPRQFDDIGRK
jgi:hypothetical protein